MSQKFAVHALITIADVDRMKHDLSKFLSISRHNETEKSVARAAIKRALEAVGLNSMTHTFIHEESNEIGANVIAVQKGPYFGTGNDKMLILSANYDTVEGSPGVDDNGSGVAAVLEAARVLSTLDNLYSRQNTIVYVFFDMKHKALAGSHAFVEDVLLPLMERTNTKVIGTVIADGLLHFDPFPASQAMPPEFESFFPEAAQLLHEHSHMGDFIQISSRNDVDEELCDIAKNFDKTAAEFGLTPIENMLSHQLERNEIDGEKKIIQNSGEKQKGEVEKIKIDKHEAYAIDILFSTGKGQPKDMDTRTTVYKKNEAVTYQLKMKASRVFFSDVNKQYLNVKFQHGPMPFSLRGFEEEVKAKMGVVECEKYGLLTPYPVLYEKEGELVAQFKATVLVMPNGLLKIAGLPFDSDTYQSELSVKDAELQTVLKSALKPKKKKEVKKEEPAAAKKA
ncbi:hypothetical protein CRE_02394 [Caenorhabditis remanei]|uniref:Peptidase M28 domain-containing protein n=1 Tax=Caenorhabditis remanei TaxID=31234 RepID=E3MIL0_CAERE|nr:hypothetical protein CRE_02394 [Caenorhabditis remanei]